jgi:hypothetical protein
LGGKFHLKLNIGERPIANKYREGKMKRTLKRELKVLEIVKREALEFSDLLGSILLFAREEPADECASLGSVGWTTGGWFLWGRASQHPFDSRGKAAGKVG